MMQYPGAAQIATQDVMKKIAALKVGESCPLKPNGFVRRKKRDLYVLMDLSNKARSRWGNYDEIVEDADHYVIYGNLPAPVGSRW